MTMSHNIEYTYCMKGRRPNSQAIDIAAVPDPAQRPDYAVHSPPKILTSPRSSAPSHPAVSREDGHLANGLYNRRAGFAQRTFQRGKVSKPHPEYRYVKGNIEGANSLRAKGKPNRNTALHFPEDALSDRPVHCVLETTSHLHKVFIC